jgi:DNA (cytosine-5)-methyltransferase 1
VDSAQNAEYVAPRLTVGSLFSGIGGIDLGLERAGMHVIWQSEIEPYASKVLAKHWPTVPNLGDITKIDWSTVERPDVVAGGFPCQPVSGAGLQRGRDDGRWLWPEFARCLRQLRPSYVLVENVPALLTVTEGRAAQEVFGDLALLGYDAQWSRISAADIGAPHLRRRIFIVAHADGAGLQGLWPERGLGEGQGEVQAPWGDWWGTEPDVGRVANGIPARVDRLRCLGNAVVPQVAEYVGRRLIAQIDG